MPRQLYGRKKTTVSKGSAAPITGAEEEQQNRNEERQVAEASAVPPEPLTTLSQPAPRPLALSDLPLDVIVPNPFQARKTFDPDRLQDLANAMKEHGIISRIRVRKAAAESSDEERYELVYGERRWRAAKLAGLTHYPVEIAPYSDDEMVEIGLLENVQREDLTPLEEAETYQRLLDQVDEQGQARYSIRKLAERIGKDKSYIEMRLAVLRTPEDVQRLVEERPETPLRTAYEIGKVADPEIRETILTDVREGKLQKVEQVKARVREATGKPPKEKTVVASTMSVAPVPPESEHSVSPLVDQAVEQQNVQGPQEEQRVSSKSSVEVINATVNSTQALILFEQQLQEDNMAITAILHRLTTKTETMTPAQQEVLVLYIDRWEQALMNLKSRARSIETMRKL